MGGKKRTEDNRTPLEVATSIADRFLKIDPPRNTYMYHFGLRSLPALWEATGDDKYLDFYMKHRGRIIFDKENPEYDLYMYNATGDKKYLKGIENVGEKFLNCEWVDSEGGYLDPSGKYTVDTYSGFMCSPIFYAHILKDDRFLDSAMLHYEVNKGYLADPITGLWYSRFGHHMHPKRNSPGRWSRGNGWLVSGWGMTQHLWNPKHHGYKQMNKEWLDLCSAVVSYRTDAGLLRQLIDREDCFEEASGTSLNFWGIAYGALYGSLPPWFADTAYEAFCGMRAMTDKAGNIHNGSTTAGGYNFERQYYSCARFNEPHADGPTIELCVAVHKLLEAKKVKDKTPPSAKPVILTKKSPGVKSHEAEPFRPPDEVALPIVKRLKKLTSLPAKDIYGSTVLGLLHLYDSNKDGALLKLAEKFLKSAKKLSPVVRWNLQAELAIRVNGTSCPGLKAFVDTELAKVHRDRDGIMVDDVGGYDVGTIYVWVPMLAKASMLTRSPEYLDEACKQLFGHKSWLEEPITCLWYGTFGHGEIKRNVNPGLWALGNGYVVSAIADLLEYLPRDHEKWIDVICLLRDHVRALATYQPVNEGWSQIIDKVVGSFHCPAGNGVITYGVCKAMINGWISNMYHPTGWGGMYACAEHVDEKGNYDKASLPTAGLNTIEAYEKHAVNNDAYALGAVLSGLGASAVFDSVVKSPLILSMTEKGVR